MGVAVVPILTRARTASDDALARFCALGSPDELTPEVARMHAPDAMYLALAEGAAVGRCSLWWTATPSLPGQRVGLIGHFAVRSAGAARELLDAARAGLREAGCTLAVGPMDGSTWRRYRLVTWRAADPRFLLEPDNPPEWPAHFEAAGFSGLAQYYSSKCDDLANYPADTELDARLKAAGFIRRPLDTQRLDQEMSLLWRMTCDAFAENYLYTPIAEAEFRHIYEPTRKALRSDFMRIVECGEHPVAFLFAVPDILQAAAGGAVDTLIIKTLGVLRSWHGRGIGNWLVDSAFADARAAGFRKGVFALMHEDNVSRKMGHGRMRDIRRYTLYGRAL